MFMCPHTCTLHTHTRHEHLLLLQTYHPTPQWPNAHMCTHICTYVLYSSKQGLVDYLQALPFCILSQRSLRNHCGSLIWHWALDSMVLSGLLKAKRAVTSTVCKHVCITVLFLNRLVPLGCIHMTNYCLSPAASVREGE